jgi:DNA repair exonuclease SbcCD ATPase subunit
MEMLQMAIASWDGERVD